MFIVGNFFFFFFFKQKTAYEMRISDWSSDVCSSDLGGTDGIYLYFRPEIRLGDWVLLTIDDQFVFYVFTLACMLLTWLFLSLLMRSRFGAALTGIRVNEQRMRAAGFSTFKYKLTAYVIGCGLAGVAGFLYAAKDGYVNPELLAWDQSGLVLLMVILGGMGRLWGAMK